MYHRFGESAHRATNIGLDQLDAHIAELTSGAYRPIALADVISAFRSGVELPERAVAITVDDAFLSFLEEAWPRFKKAGIPVTLFVSTDAIDEAGADFLSWEQIRLLKNEGVEIGHHMLSHGHMVLASNERNASDLAAASERFVQELGERPRFFAYPYGEFGKAERDLIENAGFAAAFGQYSGVAHARADRFALPRFALNESYGDMGRFRLIANALPIPVADMTPEDPKLAKNPPAVGFTLAMDIRGVSTLACFPSHTDGPARIEQLGPRIEVRFDEPFPKGRARINCTMPGPGGRWRWLGFPFYVVD